jgi:hypothetical protein
MSGGPLLLFLESPHDIKVVSAMVDSPLTHHSTLLWTFIDICSIYSHSHSMLGGLQFCSWSLHMIIELVIAMVDSPPQHHCCYPIPSHTTEFFLSPLNILLEHPHLVPHSYELH